MKYNNVNIPSSVTTIGESAFRDNQITDITLNNAVVS